MPHGIWSGDINFGLVYIPVTLYSAESHECDVKLTLLDKRDLSPVGYQKINKNTGQKVPSEQLVEGYEYQENVYVLLSKQDIRKVHPLSNQSIEILEFVNIEDIQAEYFEKPYYLIPIKKGQRAYVLLREVLHRTQKAGIAKVVIRTREYLAALIPKDKIIMLELLRFPCELIPEKQFNLPDEKTTDLKIQKNELRIAEELVNNMTKKWDPAKYKNDYQGHLLDYVAGKIKMGESYSPKKQKTEAPHHKKGEVIDIMDLLKKSIEKAKHKKPSQLKGKTAKRK